MHLDQRPQRLRAEAVRVLDEYVPSEPGGNAVTEHVYEDHWGEVLVRPSADLIELRWFDTTANMSPRWPPSVAWSRATLCAAVRLPTCQLGPMRLQLGVPAIRQGHGRSP